MSYFRNFFGGGPSDYPEEDNGAEIVEKLVERLETCDDLEDRRDALRTLRSMAKKLRVAVGSMGMNAFVDILDKEKSSSDLVALSLELLNCILSSDDETTDEDELGERFAEVLLKKPVFLPSLLACIENYEFAVRRAAIQLISSLLRHRGSEVQANVMGQPSGVACLVDSVHDNREVVRNEAILMLSELSRNNHQIQQLLAYDNAFVLLMDIIGSEPLDSIVIEDCLFVILNLLRKNSMNQELFRENNLIYRLNAIFLSFINGPEDEPEDAEWEKQRTSNLMFLLQVVRSLVSPDNAGPSTHGAQKAVYQTQLLESLCRVLLSETGVSVEVLTETVVAVAECIRGSYSNQEYFASCSLPTGENNSRPALLVLLSSMTAEKQPFKLRCAVFYCFLSYLHENEFGKIKITETLLSSDPSDAMSVGASVIQALTATESIQSWFGSVSLMHCLIDVVHLREQLLRVQVSAIADQSPISLMSHIANQLISFGNRRVQTRVGILMLLSVWLQDCPLAVDYFISNQEIVHYLTSQMVDECGEGTESEQQILKGLMAFILLTCVSQTNDQARHSLEQLVERRVGKERVITLIEGVSRTEQFVRAAQKPQPLAKVPSELFLDFQFIKLFKNREGGLVKLITTKGDFMGSTSSDGIIQSFKELIKRQDEEISVLKQEAKYRSEDLEKLKSELAKQTEKSEDTSEVDALRQQLQHLSTNSVHAESHQVQVQELQRLVQQWRAETEKYKAWAQQWQQYQVNQLANPHDSVVVQLQQQLGELEQQLAYGYTAFEEQSQNLTHQSSLVEHWQSRAELAEAQLAAAQTNKNHISSAETVENLDSKKELEDLKSEQEDLLLLLAEQHNKIIGYRRRLTELNQVVSEDEDDQ
ncbi:unnamed protein product [Auanema sp. JU1783]|nr:unnamed protein product [Auanema sp. JU1783]